MMRKLCLVLPLIAASALIVASLHGGGASAAGLGKFCGGRLGIACDRGLFCDFPIGSCGGANAEGTCVRVPRFCARRLTFRPVCGCNGRTYPNDCQRRQAIAAKRHDGRC
jgi:hypothetical protein